MPKFEVGASRGRFEHVGSSLDEVSRLHEGRSSEDGPSGNGRLLLAASAVLLALAGSFFFLPLLYVAPAPVAALVYRYGQRTGIVTALFILIVVGLSQQRIVFGAAATLLDELPSRALSLVALTVLVTIGLIGIVLGGAWREGASRWQALWLGVGGALLPGVFLAASFWFGQGVDLLQLLFDGWTTLMRGFLEQAVAGGMPEDTATALSDMIGQSEQSFPLLKPIVPGLMFITALVGVHLNGALAVGILSRSKFRPPPFPPFVTWRFPWPFALGFILGHVLALVARFNGNLAAAMVGENLLMVTGFVFVIQGVAILVYVFERRQVATFLRVLAVLVLLWWWPMVLTWFGVLDTWFHFRARGSAGNTQGGND